MPGLVRRLTTQLNALFPEIDEQDFPIEFVEGRVYNGGMGTHEFDNEQALRGFCERKPKEILNQIRALTVETFSYRNIGSVVSELSKSSPPAPKDGKIIVTHDNYAYLRPDASANILLLYQLGEKIDYICTYHPTDSVLVLGCPNEVSYNNAKSVAFAVTARLLIPEIATPETVFCQSQTQKGKCIMYGSLAEGVARTEKALSERALAFCDPCLEKITVATQHYVKNL